MILELMIALSVGAGLFGMIIGTVGTLLMNSKLLEEKVDRQLAELRCGPLTVSLRLSRACLGK